MRTSAEASNEHVTSILWHGASLEDVKDRFFLSKIFLWNFLSKNILSRKFCCRKISGDNLLRNFTLHLSWKLHFTAFLKSHFTPFPKTSLYARCREIFNRRRPFENGSQWEWEWESFAMRIVRNIHNIFFFFLDVSGGHLGGKYFREGLDIRLECSRRFLECPRRFGGTFGWKIEETFIFSRNFSRTPSSWTLICWDFSRKMRIFP